MHRPSHFNESSIGVFQHLFNDFIEVVNHTEKEVEKIPSIIRANVQELENGYALNLELPGLAKEEIKLDIEGNTLTVSVHKKEEGENFARKEFNFLNSSRKFKLSKSVDTSKIDASMKDGILSISLPKKDAYVAKDIKIK